MNIKDDKTNTKEGGYRMEMIATEKRARAYAKRHGFTVRRVTHSAQHPNGYIKVISPKGKVTAENGMYDALDVMLCEVNKKGLCRNKSNS
jgi:hypothetical protein